MATRVREVLRAQIQPKTRVGETIVSHAPLWMLRIAAHRRGHGETHTPEQPTQEAFTYGQFQEMIARDPYKTADALRHQAGAWRQILGLWGSRNIYEPEDFKKHAQAVFDSMLKVEARTIGGDLYKDQEADAWRLVKNPIERQPFGVYEPATGILHVNVETKPDDSQFIQDPPYIAALRKFVALPASEMPNHIGELGHTAILEAERFEADLIPYAQQEIIALSGLLSHVDFTRYVSSRIGDRWGVGIDQLLKSSELAALLKRDAGALEKFEKWELLNWSEALRTYTQYRVDHSLLAKEPSPTKTATADSVQRFIRELEAKIGSDALRALKAGTTLPKGNPGYHVWDYLTNQRSTFTGGIQEDKSQIDERFLDALRTELLLK